MVCGSGWRIGFHVYPTFPTMEKNIRLKEIAYLVIR